MLRHENDKTLLSSYQKYSIVKDERYLRKKLKYLISKNFAI